MPANHQTNCSTTTSINGSIEPQIDIATEFSHHDPIHTNGSTTTHTNGSTFPQITEFSHHDHAYTNGSTNNPTNGSTITLIDGSTKHPIDIAAKFLNHDPAHTNGSIRTPTRGSPTILIKCSTKPLINITTEFSHHDSAYTNGSTTTPINSTISRINGSTKPPKDIATKFSNHDPAYTNGPITIPINASTESPIINNPAYTNGSTNTPTNGSTISAHDIAAKLSHHDPTIACLNNTITPLDIATKVSHQDPTFIGLNTTTHDPTFGGLDNTTTQLDIATKLTLQDPTFGGLDNTTTQLDIATKLTLHDPTFTRLNNTTTPLDIATEFSHHDPTYARLNNGSFGCCPSTIISAQKKWQLKFLENPDYFYFNTLQPAILKSRHAIKTLINANHVNEISILDNVTTAAAIVLRHTAWSFFSGDFTSGDSVLILQKAYGAIKKSVGAYVSRAGGNVIQVPLPFPISSNEQIFTEFRKALQKGKSNGVQKIKLAIIDHVTSIPSIVIPVKEVAQICRDYGVEKIFIDGAHGIGCVDVDVNEINADFYASSLYKWFFCPPAAAFLHCKNAADWRNLHHPIVSHEYGNGLHAESSWIGTRDYSPQLLIPEVSDFMKVNFRGGIEGIRGRNHEKVVEMGEMLAKAWGTGLGAPREMCASMVMVGLPSCLGVSSDGDAWDLMERLRDCFRILAPVYYREPLEGEVGVVGLVTGYVRISHQVYNKVCDYFRLRDAVNKLVVDGFSYKGNKRFEIMNS